MGPGLRRAVFATATLAVVVACRQLVGIGDSPPMGAVVDSGAAEGGPDAGGCGIVYAGTQCEACLESNCCPQATVCAGDTACTGLEGCLGACDGGDPACRAKCVDEHRIGPDPFETQLAACLAANCVAPCGLPCGGLADTFGVDAAAGCQACIQNSVCPASLACATQPGCQAVLWCVGTTYQIDREAACFANYQDAGFDAALVLRGDLLTSCLDDCAIGNQWYCVGHLTLPQQTGQGTSLALNLYDTFYNTPVADAEVAVCSQNDPTCTPPIMSAVSGVDGGVTVTVPSNVGGSGPTGYLLINGAGLIPELAFWGFPLSEARLTDQIGTLTQTKASASQLTLLLGVPVDLQQHALVTVGVNDCENISARGVTFSIVPADLDTQVFYVTATGFSSADSGTGPQGLALFVNVPVGTVKVTASPGALGRPSSVVQGFTRAGAVTALGAPVNQ